MLPETRLRLLPRWIDGRTERFVACCRVYNTIVGMRSSAQYVLLFSMAAAITAPAQTLSTVVVFNGSNGSSPGPLVQGIDGNLYGVTYTGESFANVFYGTVFKTTTAGVLTTIYAFGPNEANPIGLSLDTNGAFYGETQQGGTITGLCTTPFCGTIFRMAPDGIPASIVSFNGTNGTDASNLISVSDGVLFGTSHAGGTNNYGTVFKITPGGTLTTLHDFAGPDGATPCDGLVLSPSGLLYGTTIGGGDSNDGTVFSMTPAGKLTTLHSFDGSDGAGACGLLSAGDDTFYGFTTAGGTANGGTVFKITADGILTTIANFAFSEAPTSLTLGTDGNLYGTVTFGTNFYGSIFELTPAGTLTVLYTFTGGPINFPGRLLQATDGNFYGTTGADGDYFGVIFRLSVGLSAFVETLPTSGKIGDTVEILGTNLTRPASVTFNGTPATITAVRPSEIIAAVPAGATTGPVEVMMSGKTLLSNAPFRIVP